MTEKAAESRRVLLQRAAGRCQCTGECGQTHLHAKPSKRVRPVRCGAPQGERIVRHSEHPGSWLIQRYVPDEFVVDYTTDVTRVELRETTVGDRKLLMCERCAALTDRRSKRSRT